ncbi:hypothetical protein Tco_0590456, partial [Tanacetum coccineum]
GDVDDDIAVILLVTLLQPGVAVTFRIFSTPLLPFRCYLILGVLYYENDDYDFDPYDDDDMYEGQDIPDKIQAICDNLDIKVRGRKKK